MDFQASNDSVVCDDTDTTCKSPQQIEIVIEDEPTEVDFAAGGCPPQKVLLATETVDGAGHNAYTAKKNVAEGMMDIALLTANANQLRFLITYNTESRTYYLSVSLIVLSLLLQLAVGFGLIFKRQMKNKGKKQRVNRTNEFLVSGVFLVTIINVFVASFTVTESKSAN